MESRDAIRTAPRYAVNRPIALTIFALGALLAVYAWLLVPPLGKPLVYDDVNFALGGWAISRTGLPYGNQGYLLHLYEQREQWALWHPPLYLYTLGLTIALFGPSEVVMRGLGIACQLVAATLAFDLARRLARGEAGGGRDEARGSCSSLVSRSLPLVAGVVAVALFLLSPLTIQAALVLDIDNTVLMALVTFYVWVALRLPGHWDRRTIAGLTLLYALTLWAKLTTPLMLLAALTFTRFFTGASLRGALQALLVGVLGWALFLASWVAVTTATGMPPDYTFIVAYREAIDSGASTRDGFVSWAAFVVGAAPALLWIGPFFGLLFLAAGLPRLWRLIRRRELEPGDLVVVLGAVIYLAYIMKLAGGFPKYHAGMLPLWAAAGGALVARSALPGSWDESGGAREGDLPRRPTWGQLAVLGIGMLAAGGWLAARMPELWEPVLAAPLVRLLIVVPAAVGLAVAGLWVRIGRVGAHRALPVALAGLALAWSIVLDVHQRGLAGSTAYYYGRHGQVEAARALDGLLGPEELYVASKEVAWYSHNLNYIDQESWQHVVWDLHGGTFDSTWMGREIRILALEVGHHPSVRPAYEGLLNSRYRIVGQHGDFVIWERP